MLYPGDTPKEDPRQFDSGRDAWLRAGVSAVTAPPVTLRLTPAQLAVVMEALSQLPARVGAAVRAEVERQAGAAVGDAGSRAGLTM